MDEQQGRKEGVKQAAEVRRCKRKRPVGERDKCGRRVKKKNVIEREGKDVEQDGCL